MARTGKAPIFWITGIPAAGKTTLGYKLVFYFRALGQRAEIIDGDEARRVISSELGFSRSDRLLNNKRMAWTARLLARNGVIAIVAAVSPYLEGREEARHEAGIQDIPFIEIFASCSLAVAMKRDSKGVYETGKGVTGLDGPYEVPAKPEITVDTDLLSADAALAEVLKALPTLDPLTR